MAAGNPPLALYHSVPRRDRYPRAFRRPPVLHRRLFQIPFSQRILIPQRRSRPRPYTGNCHAAAAHLPRPRPRLLFRFESHGHDMVQRRLPQHDHRLHRRPQPPQRQHRLLRRVGKLMAHRGVAHHFHDSGQPQLPAFHRHSPPHLEPRHPGRRCPLVPWNLLPGHRADHLRPLL